MVEKTVMTEKQIADVFQVSTRTVQRWVQRGCPCRTAPGLKRKRLFRLDLVSEWLYEAGEPMQRLEPPTEKEGEQ